jgi:S-adenosyl methyltransferase
VTGEHRPTTDIDYNIPHSARIWNYWMGGKDNYDVDRIAGDEWAKQDPEIVPCAIQSRQYIIRVVRYLAGECGIRQFLDIGTGLPTMQNTHEVAQSVAPDAKIVYIDNDPVVLAHARALLTNTTDEGVTAYIDADLRNPEQIISDARNILNFHQPIAVMFMGVLGHVANLDEACSIVRTVLDAVVPGSHVAHYDGLMTPLRRAAQQEYADTGAVPYHNREPEELARLYEGLEIVEPGLVSPSLWRPNHSQVGTPEPVSLYGGVARKP